MDFSLASFFWGVASAFALLFVLVVIVFVVAYFAALRKQSEEIATLEEMTDAILMTAEGLDADPENEQAL